MGFSDFLAGGASGVVTRMCIHPLDLVKIRLQLQLESAGEEKRYYRNARHVFRRVVRDEGIAALWKGHLNAQVLSGSYAFVQYGIYNELVDRIAVNFAGCKRKKLTDEQYNRLIASTDEKNSSNGLCINNRKLKYPELNCLTSNEIRIMETSFVAIAATCATIVAQPIDVLRTRFAAQGEPKMYKSIYDAFHQMRLNEGYRSFYRGLAPGLMNAVPQMVLSLDFFNYLYPKIESVTIKCFNFKTTDNKCVAVTAATSGFIAGVSSKMIIYPFDLIKKRLQVQGFDQARIKFGRFVKYQGFTDCARQIIRYEGVIGFYKGAVPSIVKAAFVSSLHFLTYDMISHMKRERIKENMDKVANTSDKF
ncbi:hypothetical protein SNEBB_004012 [Seison nebaliae]|nr:hypothetical protein SNEBB_004012 [Seison nebaliae]